MTFDALIENLQQRQQDVDSNAFADLESLVSRLLEANGMMSNALKDACREALDNHVIDIDEFVFLRKLPNVEALDLC